MNLWFRLIWMLLTVRLRGPLKLSDTAVLRLRVLPNDLDFNGHVNNGRYFTLADLGRLDFSIRTGLMSVAIANRAIPLLGDAMARFRKDLRPFQRFDLETRLLGGDDKWGFFEHRFVRGGRVVGVVVTRGQFRTAQGPLTRSTLLTGLGLAQDTPSPPLPSWVLAWHRGCEDLGAALREEEQRAVSELPA
jgi:acyl-CoA thioesterase FadM